MPQESAYIQLTNIAGSGHTTVRVGLPILCKLLDTTRLPQKEKQHIIDIIARKLRREQVHISNPH